MKKFNKVIALVGAAVMGATLLAGCGTKVEDTANPAADTATTETTTSADKYDLSGVTLISDGVLSVGEEVGYPPFEDFAED